MTDYDKFMNLLNQLVERAYELGQRDGYDVQKQHPFVDYTKIKLLHAEQKKETLSALYEDIKLVFEEESNHE